MAAVLACLPLLSHGSGADATRGVAHPVALLRATDEPLPPEDHSGPGQCAAAASWACPDFPGSFTLAAAGSALATQHRAWLQRRAGRLLGAPAAGNRSVEFTSEVWRAPDGTPHAFRRCSMLPVGGGGAAVDAVLVYPARGIAEGRPIGPARILLGLCATAVGAGVMGMGISWIRKLDDDMLGVEKAAAAACQEVDERHAEFLREAGLGSPPGEPS
eukprot:TRINITY_DN15572_c0_g1_i3.p2 TRINITY_DN15572_c0_g1~~TRINITY_DN15572_c0_g1_i3.p2  ORF type:complete len:216 (+),score=38.75 TRINITY_DN15572_c0_g1_i3:64-711(+)